MKKAICILLICSALAAFVGCNRKNGYSNHIPCSELMTVALEQIPVDLGYEAYDSEHVDYFFGGELYNDFSVYYSVKSADINEVGIFHTKDEDSANKLREKIDEYLKKELEENKVFIESYAPKELEKLERAEVRALGNYVVFTVLDTEDKALFFDTLEIMLQEP